MTSNTNTNNNNNINMNLNMNNQQLTNNINMNANNPSPAIQQLAQRQMQNMNPALKEYKNQLFQQQQQYDNNQQLQQPQMPGGRGENDDGEPSDLDNTNLYIKGLWKDCTQVELDDLFKQFGVICQSRVYGDGVGFVRFETGKQAKAAIDTMDKAKLDKCQDQLLVKYAFKKQRNSKRYIREVEMIMNKNTNNVYLRCLPRGFTEKQLIELCDPYGELTCTRLRESGVAFVRYRKAEDAQTAIRSLNGKRFDGQNETLLAKLANSDPFQPKIGFKQRPFDEEDISSVPESTNTMTPSQGPNDTYNQQQIHNTHSSQKQQTSSSHHAQQQMNKQQQQQQQQQLHHTTNQYQSHTQYTSPHHHNPSYPPQQQQQTHQHYNPPQYEQHHGGYNHYGPPPNTQHPSPYDARHTTAYSAHYAPPHNPQQPAPYPHNYTNAASAYPPPQQQPPAPYGTQPQPTNNGNVTPNQQQQAQQGQPPPIHAYTAAPAYYQPYPGYSAYYAPQPTYAVPQPAQQPITPQPVPPPTQPQPVTIPQVQPQQQSISTPPQTITSNTSQPGTTTTTNTTSPSALTSVNAAPTTVTSVTTATSVSSTNVSIQKKEDSSKSAQTPTKNTGKTTPKQPSTTPPKSDKPTAPLKPPSILTPNISNVSNLSAQNAKPVASAIYVPTQAPNGQIMYAPATAQSAVLMTAAPFIQGLQSPPGSELSFRHHTGGPGSELSSIAGHAVSDIIASHHPILGTAASKVAGRNPAIPSTPEKISLQTSKISPYANITTPVGGHISPGPQNYASPAHQWRTAANAAFPAVAVQPITAAVQPPTTAAVTTTESGGIEAAKQGPLAIVQDNPITNALAAAVQKGVSAAEAKQQQQQQQKESVTELDKVPDLGNLPPMEHKTLSKKTSNPHDVSKECANKLHGVISSWYPQKAGKLTGMFLQNHDEDKVVKYLKRPEKLKKKIDTFVSLLSNSMPKANNE